MGIPSILRKKHPSAQSNIGQGYQFFNFKIKRMVKKMVFGGGLPLLTPVAILAESY